MYKFIFKDVNDVIVYESVSNFSKESDAKFAGECYYDSDKFPTVISVDTKLYY